MSDIAFFSLKKESSAYNIMDNEATVIHTETSAYYSLNVVGTLLWELLSERKFSSDQLAELLANHYQLNKGEAEKDIDTFLQKLDEADFVNKIMGDSTEATPKHVDMKGDLNLENYESPDLVKFGDLETLMLSGE